MEDIHGDTLSYRATCRRRPAILRMLLLTKVETQAQPRTHHGSNLLLLAAGAGYTYSVKLLLARDDVNVSGFDNGQYADDVYGAGLKGIAMTRRTMLEVLECGMLQAVVGKRSSRQLVA